MNFFPTLFLIATVVFLYRAAKAGSGEGKWPNLLGALGCFLMIGVTSPGAPKSEATAKAESKAASSSTSQRRENSSDDPYADVGKQYAWISTGKNAIQSKLKDPESAQFRNVAFYSGGGVPVVCGEVNAHNSFGGYAGYERFIAAGSSMAYLESEVSDGIGEVWSKMCVKAPKDQAYDR